MPQPLGTLLRNGTIAILGGFVLSQFWGGMARWPASILLLIWPTLGGHFVELGFLYVVRPRLPRNRMIQIVSRLMIWMLGGMILAAAMVMTGRAIGFTRVSGPPWWVGALGFTLIELAVHLLLQLRGKPNFTGLG